MPIDPAEVVSINDASFTNDEGVVCFSIDDAAAPMQNRLFKIQPELARKLHKDLEIALSESSVS